MAEKKEERNDIARNRRSRYMMPFLEEEGGVGLVRCGRMGVDKGDAIAADGG